MTNKPRHGAPRTPAEPSQPLPGGAIDPTKLNLRDELLALNRCAKVVKGGRRFSFSALVAVGDGEGHVGLGFGKANEVPESIAKATQNARKSLHAIPLMGRTIPHDTIGRFLTARVMLKPARPGTGLIANQTVRKIAELAGIGDILAKSLGSDNAMNVAKATMEGLATLRRPEQVARLRGKRMEDLIGARASAIYVDTMRRYFGEQLDEKPAQEAGAKGEEAGAGESKAGEPAPEPAQDAGEQKPQAPAAESES